MGLEWTPFPLALLSFRLSSFLPPYAIGVGRKLSIICVLCYFGFSLSHPDILAACTCFSSVLVPVKPSTRSMMFLSLFWDGKKKT